MNRPTIKDLARSAGVSISTVDRVLNGRDPVKPQTAQRVAEAAESIGYWASGLLRKRLKSDAPERTLGFLLQQRSTPFYEHLGAALSAATLGSGAIRGRPLVEFMDDLTPGAVAERLVRLGKKADGVAVVAADHPNVTEAVESLKAQGKPVLALISDLTANGRAGYVGLENRRVGRTAAWFLAKLAGRPGNLAVFVGSHRYLCQESREIGFRTYLREKAPGFELIEALTTLESDRDAYEAALDLLNRIPDLVGIYVAGGGEEGVLRALAETQSTSHVAVVCHELSDRTRPGLVNGLVQTVLSHPIRTLAEQTVDLMARLAEGNAERDLLSQVIVPFDICTPENM